MTEFSIRPADMPEFGPSPADISIAERAEFYTYWFTQTGWAPKDGDLDEASVFASQVVEALSQDPDVDVADPQVLMAIDAGIMRELGRSRAEHRH